MAHSIVHSINDIYKIPTDTLIFNPAKTKEAIINEYLKNETSERDIEYINKLLENYNFNNKHIQLTY